tara:strand:+ start:22 stop:639 length:618 start_codon:yes stop_codon:yes gene_type:complete
MIGIVNYGAGNVGAIKKIYKNLNIETILINKPEDFDKAEKIILPGVGAFDEVMKKLNSSGLIKELNNQVLLKKKYVLGICVGMQIMAKNSDEGKLEGLGWIDGKVKKINIKNLAHKPYLPHMGWNGIHPTVIHPLFNNIDFEFGFYFVHSYYFECNDKKNILCETDYSFKFCSSLVKKNILATQFHPEKSHKNGVLLFRNFYELK